MSETGAFSTRRAILKSAALPGALVAGCASTNRREAPLPRLAQIADDLHTYAEFGAKNAGGAGDTASGVWIERRLAALGYETLRQSVPALAIDAANPELIIRGHSIPLAVHRPGKGGAFDTLDAPLDVWGANATGECASGAILLAHLPRQRWSSERQPYIRALSARAFQSGAAALILITHGPTGEAIQLNRTLDRADHGPIALLAPKEWSRLPQPVGDRADLRLRAREGPREAFNVIGRLDRGAARWIVVSSPRSGWGVCAGERGPGIALFLALAESVRSFSDFNLLFVCASSHEFENRGAEAFLEHQAPAPQDVALWLHLGAGIAARDWHEAGSRLLPLPSADPQRYLMTTPQFLESARTAFAGLPGLEAAYSTDEGASGELATIVAAGYPRIAGMFGAHRFHHVASDDLRCAPPEQSAAVSQRLHAALPAWLA